MMHPKISTFAAVVLLAACSDAGTPDATGPALAKGGSNGTTLAAVKTLEICTMPDGSLLGSGEISVWNAGAIATTGLAINDRIQISTGGGPYTNYAAVTNITPSPAATVIPAGTDISDPLHPATVFSYTVSFPAVAGATFRNAAKVTITNHSGSLGTPTGPEPKYTFVGTPPPCSPSLGCTLTQGYWKNLGPEQNPHTWPAAFDRGALFFNSGLTWQQVLDTAPQGSGYFILAHQYIAAVLNVANGAAVPPGVQTAINFAESYFNGFTAPSKGESVAQATVLDDYNNGVYPGGPPHCS